MVAIGEVDETSTDKVSGKSRAGVYLGRARKLSPDQIDSARQLIDGGVLKAKIARDLGCSRRVLYDLLGGAYASPPTVSVMPVGAHDS